MHSREKLDWKVLLGHPVYLDKGLEMCNVFRYNYHSQLCDSRVHQVIQVFTVDQDIQDQRASRGSQGRRGHLERKDGV